MTIKPEEKEKERKLEVKETENVSKAPYILEEIQIEELAVDGICGIY